MYPVFQVVEYRYLELQVVVGLGAVPLDDLLPVGPDVGQDLVQVGLDRRLRLVHIQAGHLVVQHPDVLQDTEQRG